MIPRQRDQVSRFFLLSRKHFFQELQNDVTDIYDHKILNCVVNVSENTFPQQLPNKIQDIDDPGDLNCIYLSMFVCQLLCNVDRIVFRLNNKHY
jgi:hypothetical protein